MNIAFVLPIFISKSFAVQNFKKWFSSYYNSSGDGASSTRSSAKARTNNYKDAIVNACLFVPSTLLVL
jgi:hypothetical protein